MCTPTSVRPLSLQEPRKDCRVDTHALYAPHRPFALGLAGRMDQANASDLVSVRLHRHHSRGVPAINMHARVFLLSSAYARMRRTDESTGGTLLLQFRVDL